MKSSGEHYSHENPTNHTKKYLLRGLGALAAAGALIGAIHYGPRVIEDVVTVATDQSEVVAGVPGLVVGYDSKDVWTGKFFVERYWLDVEQCPKDVSAAQHGNPNSQSFNTDPSAITAGCYADWVSVNGDTFSHFGDGTTITFDGDPTEHLRK